MFIKYKKLLCVALLGISLAGCGKKNPNDPIVGEYGERMISSESLSDQFIDAINHPPEKDEDQKFIDLPYFADPNQNPYRAVLIVKGHAIQKGKVDIRFLSNLAINGSGGRMASLQSEDSHRYDANESVKLIVSSEPFSFDVNKNKAYERAVQISSVHKENIQIDSIQFQMWQGKGNHKSFLYYFGWFVLLSSIFLFCLRFTSISDSIFSNSNKRRIGK